MPTEKRSFWKVLFCRLERHRSLPTLQPFCPIITKCTREVVGFNSLADVLKRLDFQSAVHDIRRFQYVSTILKLLLTPEKLYQLAGASQKLIFRFRLENILTIIFFLFIYFLLIYSSPHPSCISIIKQGKHFSPLTLLPTHNPTSFYTTNKLGLSCANLRYADRPN